MNLSWRSDEPEHPLPHRRAGFFGILGTLNPAMIFDKTILKQMWKASTAGLNIVIATVVGGAIGYFLEKLLGLESHWLLFIFALLGVAAGFRDLFRMTKNIDEGPDTENK